MRIENRVRISRQDLHGGGKHGSFKEMKDGQGPKSARP